MTVANVSQGNARGLPDALIAAQAAIHLPEVQEMLCRLSEFKLGIFMPHMHDDQTGEFLPLPENLIQVESDLEVSFQPTETITDQPNCFLPVGWVWRGGEAATVSACVMAWEVGHGDTEGIAKHT